MRNNILTAVAAAAFAGSLALAAPATAAVTFDPDTGTGFVGKGDVQTAFTWNNQQLQKNAAGVTFSYESENNYDAVCQWITGEGKKGEKTHLVSHKVSANLASSVAYDARVKTQITGFTLTGLGATTSSGSVPEVGGPCMGNEGHDGTWSSVDLTGSSAGLYVSYSGTSVLIL